MNAAGIWGLGFPSRSVSTFWSLLLGCQGRGHLTGAGGGDLPLPSWEEGRLQQGLASPTGKMESLRSQEQKGLVKSGLLTPSPALLLITPWRPELWKEQRRRQRGKG